MIHIVGLFLGDINVQWSPYVSNSPADVPLNCSGKGHMWLISEKWHPLIFPGGLMAVSDKQFQMDGSVGERFTESLDLHWAVGEKADYYVSGQTARFLHIRFVETESQCELLGIAFCTCCTFAHHISRHIMWRQQLVSNNIILHAMWADSP